MVDGCSVGLVSISKQLCGTPIGKAWKVATDCPDLVRNLSGLVCPGKLAHPVHARTQGVDTQVGEGYTDKFAEAVHKSLADRGKTVVVVKSATDDKSAANCSYKPTCYAVDDDDWSCVGPRDVPQMSRRPQSMSQEHREKLVSSLPLLNACIARLLKPAEVKLNKKAMQAVLDEAKSLQEIVTWDISTVREFNEITEEYRKADKKAHFGRVFPICSEKNSELAPDDPQRTFKGRICFQGNGVKDEKGEWAIFAEMSSCPATMEGSRACDMYGLVEGNTCEQSDAKRAYVQTTLGGIETWVELPDILRPAEWAGYKRPVCRLLLNLYGHPDAGGYWENHSFNIITKAGFTQVEGWPSLFWHEELKLLLIVYVDDFKMAGPSSSMKRGWSLLKDIDMVPGSSGAITRWLNIPTVGKWSMT